MGVHQQIDCAYEVESINRVMMGLCCEIRSLRSEAVKGAFYTTF